MTASESSLLEAWVILFFATREVLCAVYAIIGGIFKFDFVAMQNTKMNAPILDASRPSDFSRSVSSLPSTKTEPKSESGRPFHRTKSFELTTKGLKSQVREQTAPPKQRSRPFMVSLLGRFTVWPMPSALPLLDFSNDTPNGAARTASVWHNAIPDGFPSSPLHS